MTGAFAFRTGCVSDVGLARELNEDNVLAHPDVGLWVVADGMGGHGGGDVASGAVVSALRTLAPSATAAELLAEFETRIVWVNTDLRAIARARGAAILGTTLVALLIHGTHFACVWCGDSRVLSPPRWRAVAALARPFRGPGAHRPRPLASGRGQGLAPPERRDPGARRDRPSRSGNRGRAGPCRRPLPALQRRSDHPCGRQRDRGAA